ncbi:MAG: carboxypeptidase regulatory-like domain-containing protein [Candidatus Thiodiazotropha sp.]
MDISKYREIVMAQAMHGRFKQIQSLVFFLLFVLTANVASAIDSAWLSSQQTSDGSFESSNAIASTFQATSEAILAIYALDESSQSGIPAAIQYLENDTFQSTEHLAQLTMVNLASGRDASTYLSELANRASADGGFGELPGYDSTAIDTAYALNAMASAGLQLSDTASYAIAFLLDRQNTDGGWSNRKNVTSLYVTALVSSALQRYRHHYVLNDALERANGLLISSRDTQGAIGDVFETAMALIALAPMTYDRSLYQNTVDYLTSVQLADGSWNTDVYTTALALRALNAVQTIVPTDPSSGIVSGLITDSVTGSPLANVEIGVEVNSRIKTTTTDTHGLYVITDIEVGSASLSASVDGYLSIVASGSVVAGQTLNFSPSMARDPTPRSLHLVGTVADGTNGSWLHGARVSILNSDYLAITDTSGNFSISGVPPGSYTVEVSHAGYAPRLYSLSSPDGGSMNLGKMSLLPEIAQVSTGTVRGLVTDSTNGKPLTGVAVAITGSDIKSTVTDDTGHFLIDSVSPGDIVFTASLNGYNSASADAIVNANAISTLNITLLPIGQLASSTLDIKGNVVDAVTLKPLQDARVEVLDSAYNLTVDGDGAFHISDIPAGIIDVEVAHPGYLSKRYSISAPDGGVVSIGSVGLVQDNSSTTTGAVRGIVTDALSGMPLHGAEISLSGSDNQVVNSGVDGRFSLPSVTPGSLTVSATIQDYRTSVATGVVVAGGLLDVTMELVKSDDPTTATVIGNVVDAHTLSPLSGVLITIEGDGHETQSAANGEFVLSGAPAGVFQVRVQLLGYNAITYNVNAPDGGLVDLGRIALAQDTPVSSNHTPVITSAAPDSAVAGLMYQYQVTAEDSDGDTLTYGISDNPGGMEIDPDSGAISWIPTADQSGMHEYSVVVSDDKGSVATQSVSVNVQISGYPTYVITDVETLNGMVVDGLVPDNYRLGSYLSGGRSGTWRAVSANGCGFAYTEEADAKASAAESLDFWSMGSGGGSDAIWDMGALYDVISVFPLIDHEPFPHEGIEYTVWGSNDPTAIFPDEWKMATLIRVYGQGWADNSSSCTEAINIDDYAGLYTFGYESFRYVRLKADNSITIFDTPDYTTFSSTGDDGVQPGWQSSESEIDAIGGMLCDVKPVAEAGDPIYGLSGDTIQFDGSASQGNIQSYGWDLDGDREIDLSGSQPTWVFNAGFDQDATLYVVDDRGCVGTDTTHVTITLDIPRPDLTVSEFSREQIKTNLQTLQVRGSVRITVANIGVADVISPAIVSIFEDTNKNGTYDVGVDNNLGTTTTPSGLPRDGSLSMEIPLNGEISFRDNHIYAMVDSGAQIEESNETNNIASTLSECRATPPQAGDLSLEMKWLWRGSVARPDSYYIYGPVMVGQLSDDNSDGVINTSDTPDLVFTSNGGVLNVVSGDDGHDIWTDTTHYIADHGSPTLGDIDGDGIVEILVTRRDRTQLLAFEHNGDLKWSVPAGPKHPNATRDGIAIADLDHDGSPEIILGRRVYSAEGNLVWEGSRDYAGQRSYGFLSIAADVDNQGDMEVVAGRTLYDSSGNVLWHRSDLSSDGFNGIGNFDDDDFAEIVLVAGGRVYVLEHTGETKWGPVSLPGGGYGGAPTVGDFDADGEPEIGVAASSNYVVFETDGSVKWTAPVRDYSSSRTGSSLFDFESDGSAEVLYADERNFYIYDGKTGEELVNIQNGSPTVLEYPVVADVDNDGSAEIVLASYPYLGGSGGLRVFESAGAGWAPTRSIWNQHSYHIDNINDDGTIPRYETASWLTHNTYRLNTFPDRDPLDLPDLSASRLKVIDNGVGQPASLSVRVGNSGAGPLPGESKIAFYQGDPQQGGILLGERTVSNMPSGSYQDVTLDNIPTLRDSADIYAVADAGNHLFECNETNNRVVLPVSVQSRSGNIDVSTDSPAYGPDSIVGFNVSVTNTSALPGEFIVKLQVVDQSDTPVINFDNRDVGPLDGTEAIAFAENWNSQNTLAGPYRLQGELYGRDGTLLDSSTSLFDIRHAEDVSTSKLNLRINTDKAIYNTSDQVRIEDLVQNLTTNNKITGAMLQVRVTDPLGSETMITDQQIAELMPRGQRGFESLFSLQNAAEGSYQVVGQVIALGGGILASDSAVFNVQEDTFLSLSANVTAQNPSIYQGDTEVCADSITHRGTLSLDNLNLRQVLIATEPEQQISSAGQAISLAAGDSWSDIRGIDTASLEVGTYACVLQAEITGEWETLAFAYFQVLEPPINIDIALGHGDHGRVLVLLDASGEKCSGVRELNIETDIDGELEPEASVVVELFDKNDVLIDREHAHLDTRSVNQRVGSGGIDLSILDFSANHISLGLDGAGSAKGVLGNGYRALATITRPDGRMRFDSGHFSADCNRDEGQHHRHGNYRTASVSMIKAKHHSHEDHHLPSLRVQQDFLELLLSQSGWSYTIVTDKEAFKQELRSGAYSTYLLLSERVKLDEKTQKELREAVYRGEGLLVAGGHDHRQGRLDQALGIRFMGKHNRATGIVLSESELHSAATASFSLPDKKPRVRTDGAIVNGVFMSNAVQTQEPAVTTFDYGLGRSAYVGYDLLAEAALTESHQSIHAQLILAGLNYVDYSPEVPLAGQAYPLRLSLTNQGIATPGRARIALPEDVLVIDSGGAMLTDPTTLIWPFDLGLDETLVFETLLSLPQHTVDVQAVVQTGIEPDYVDHATAGVLITPQPGFSAQDALDAVEAVDSRDYRKVKKYLMWAVEDVTANCYEKALDALVRASDELIRIGSPESESIREIVASAIRSVSLMIEPASCHRPGHCSHERRLKLH